MCSFQGVGMTHSFGSHDNPGTREERKGDDEGIYACVNTIYKIYIYIYTCIYLNVYYI